MTLSELYAALGGDVQAVLARIPSEAMIRKFAKMYPQDTSFAELRQAVGACDWDGAFRAAHTLKGVALNLGFSELADAASALTEHLRGGNALTQPALLQAVEDAHAQALRALNELDA